MDSIQKHLHIRMPAACPQSESSKFPSFPETKLANLTEEFLPLSCNFASSAEPKEMGRPEWEEINNREREMEMDIEVAVEIERVGGGPQPPLLNFRDTHEITLELVAESRTTKPCGLIRGPVATGRGGRWQVAGGRWELLRWKIRAGD